MAQIDDVLNQTELVQKKMAARTAPLRAEIDESSGAVASAAASVQRQAAEPMPPPPDLKPLPTRPETGYRDTMNAFLNPMVVMSMFAGLLTRAPLTTALSAGAAAMRGYHQGDVDAFKREEKIFEDNFEQALKTNEEELRQYRQILDNRALTMADKQAALSAATATYQNKTMRLAIENGDFDKANQIVTALQNHNDQMKLAQQKYNLDKDYFGETVRHNKAMEQISKTRLGRTGAFKTLASERVDAIEKAKSEFVSKNGREPNATETRKIINDVVKGGLTGGQAERIEAQIDMIDTSLDKIGDVTSVLENYVLAAGLSGRPARLGESVSNIFGSNQTDRMQMRRDIEYLHMVGARLLMGAHGRPLSAEEKKIGDIIGGLNMQDTTKNTLRSLDEVQKIYMKMRSDSFERLGGDWKPREQRPGASEPDAGGGRPSWEDAPVVGVPGG